MFICQIGSAFAVVATSHFRQMFTSFCENIPLFARQSFVEVELKKVYVPLLCHPIMMSMKMEEQFPILFVKS